MLCLCVYCRLQYLLTLQENMPEWLVLALRQCSYHVEEWGLCWHCEVVPHCMRHSMKCAPSTRRACYGVLRFIMESGAKGCEVIVSGKLRAQRAKAMKFKDGYMISSGQPVNDYIDSAVRHVLLRQGVLGIKVRAPFWAWTPGVRDPHLPPACCASWAPGWVHACMRVITASCALSAAVLSRTSRHVSSL